MKSYKGHMENIPYPGHNFTDNTSPFKKAEKNWKTILVRKNFNLKNGLKCGKSEVSCEVSSLIDVENDQ